LPVTDILYVTKPLVPPWIDSGKLLPYLLVKNLPDFRIAVMIPKGKPLDFPNAVNEEIYSEGSSFSVPGAEKIRIMTRLLTRSTPSIIHFFFSPNGPTSMAARLVKKTHKGVSVVQTVMSLPEHQGALADGIFADRVIVWSRYAAARVSEIVLSRGLDSKVIHVPPGIEPLEPIVGDARKHLRTTFGLPPDAKIVLYAGDLEFSSGAVVTAEAARILKDRMRVVFVFACRPKTPASKKVLAEIEASLSSEVLAGRVRFMGQVSNFRDLVRCADVQVLPVETTYAKTDIPLVILEGLSAGIPAVVGTGTPMDELVDAGAAIGVVPRSPEALADCLSNLLMSGGSARVLAETGRRYVLANHSAEVMARAHAGIYQELNRMMF
jgi:glycosyltransferase involved in cell wall biosynthesis